MRELKQTWTGRGKNNCFEAIRQANHWLHSNRPDKFYDTDYAMRGMNCTVMNYSMVCWWNDDKHGELCDLIDKLCKQIENMKEDDSYYINARFIKDWF